MEKLNLILNLIIIAYIVIKEMSNIKRGINTVKEYITVLKTQVIAKTIYDNVQDDEYDKEFTRKCHAVARGEINNSYFNDLDEIVVDENGLPLEEENTTEFLLATCILKKEQCEVVVDFDLRGEGCSPLDFSMFGGYKEQHYDIDLIKSFGGEERPTESYYAFLRTVETMGRSNKQIKVEDTHVLIAKISKKDLYKALKIEVLDDDVFNERDNSSLIEPNATIVDVEDESANKEEEEVDFDEMLNEGAEKGYEVYTTINVLKQAAKMMLKHQEDIAKHYKEYKEQKVQESFDELDSIVTAINKSRYAVKTNELPTSIDELIGGTI